MNLILIVFYRVAGTGLTQFPVMPTIGGVMTNPCTQPG